MRVALLNRLISSTGYLKLIDFGFAKRLVAGTKTFTMCGTPEYLAPEVVVGLGHDTSADCWSLGILVFELISYCLLVLSY